MKNSANTTYPLRSILIPLVLLVYLAVMVVLGWPSYECGATSGLLYFGGTAVTLTCIVALHFPFEAAHRAQAQLNLSSSPQLFI